MSNFRPGQNPGNTGQSSQQWQPPVMSTFSPVTSTNTFSPAAPPTAFQPAGALAPPPTGPPIGAPPTTTGPPPITGTAPPPPTTTYLATAPPTAPPTARTPLAPPPTSPPPVAYSAPPTGAQQPPQNVNNVNSNNNNNTNNNNNNNFNNANNGAIASPVSYQPQKMDLSQVTNPCVSDSAGSILYRVDSLDPPPRSDQLYSVVGMGNCSPRFLRSSAYVLPTDGSVAQACGLTLGVVMQPFAEVGDDEEPVQLVDAGAEGPPRCNRCQAYINCHCTFVSSGNSYVCSLCQFVNPVPTGYYSPLGPDGRRHDYVARVELSRGSVDFVATSKYMSRTPKPAAYMFVVDVSAPALNAGHVHYVARCIRETLASLPSMSEAHVGLVTYNNHVQFYNLLASQTQASMHVLADVASPFVPLPADACLVPYSACHELLNQLLDDLPALFEPTKEHFGRAAVGAAIASAGAALADAGGKVMLFASTIASAGAGVLQPRDNAALYGTAREEPLLAPLKTASGKFYVELADKLAAQRARVDLFVLAPDYVDLATLSTVAHKTSGEIYKYTGFEPARDGARLKRDLMRNLARPFVYECLLRVRCSEGLAVSAHLGHLKPFNSTDIEFAGMDSDTSLAVTLVHDAVVPPNTNAVVQCAVLYTSAEGVRRIRVHTLALKTSSDVSTVFRGVDLDAYVGVTVREACFGTLAAGALASARHDMIDRAVASLAAYRKHCSKSSPPGQLILPEALKLLPIFMLAALRSAALRRDKCYRPDERVFVRHLLLGAPLSFCLLMLYPRLIALHDEIDDLSASLFDSVPLALPAALSLSAKSLEPTGIFALHNGVSQLVFLGPQASPELAELLFGSARPSPVELSQMTALNKPEPAALDASEQGPVAQQAVETLERLALRYPERAPEFMTTWRGAGRREAILLAQMVDDAAPHSKAYMDWLVQLHRMITSKMQQDDRVMEALFSDNF